MSELRDDRERHPSKGRTVGGLVRWSAAASLVSGLGALGFLTVGRLAVGLEGFAPMAHIWTIWSISAATVGLGAQIQGVEGYLHGTSSRWKVFRVAIVFAGVIAAVTMAFRQTLFSSTGIYWPIIATLIPFGSLLTGTVRGALAASGSRRRLAVVIGGENAIRFAGAAIVWLFGGDARLLGLALLSGFLAAGVGLALIGRTSRRSGISSRIGESGAFAGLIAHLVLILPPSVMALQGAAPELVSAVFLVLTYLRAPYQFLLGLGPVLTVDGIRKASSGSRSRLTHASTMFGLGVLAMAMAAAGMYVIGSWVSAVLVGDATLLVPTDLSILAALVVAVSLAIVRTMYALGQGSRQQVVRAWIVVAVALTAASIVAVDMTVYFAILLAAVGVGLGMLVKQGVQ